MSKIFQKGENVVLYIPLPDETALGTPIAEARYSVYDMNNKVLIDGDVLPLDDVSIGTFGSEVTLNIPPFYYDNPNPVPGSARDFYRVVVKFIAQSGFIHQHLDEFYYEDTLTDLEPFVNGFSSYGYMMTLAGSRSDMGAFIESDFDIRISALIQAFEDIKACPLIITRTVDNVDTAYSIIPSLVDGTLTLTDAEVRTLSLAQVQQANYILGGYAAEDLRRVGIRQENAGSTSTLYRAGKVLPVVVCNAAQNTLKPYFKWKVRVTHT